ncbi:hypothetical protein CCR85_00085 [Rhodothalassium salexigens]|uniref:flavin monoamine oxidase family protein n=1 Tax=Rhodothalassium salexigens TaxID=1086 RepID=UPI0019143D3F|nr:NAD(P)/FAD-dependent oxidoreductase [Rhodothalassium salexigens]MBK5909891.1 hypothetical protein [Rhodothalassium salexigens]MBK5922028.1 hypothetical protein [Rhodothalassium salexigens]
MGAAYDIAIVGGGVSGAYAADRLSRERPGARIALFEASERLGGRLWSVELPEVPGVIAELGGTNFSAQQPLVTGLVDALGLAKTEVDAGVWLSYLRDHRLVEADFADADKVPYFVTPEEAGQNPYALLMAALFDALPGLQDHLPVTAETLDALIAYLRTATVDGRPLHSLGFANMLSARLSPEAFALVRDNTGHPTALANGNAYNMTLHLLVSSAGPFYVLDAGFQSLVEALAARAHDAGCTVRKGHRLTSLRFAGADDGVALTFATARGTETIEAAQVICALPPAALSGIRLTDADATPRTWPVDLDKVVGLPAAKTFLVYPEPWWQDLPGGPGQITRSAMTISNTNLPLCACYYWGAADYSDSGPALLLGAYADGDCVDFWSGMMPPDAVPCAGMDPAEAPRQAPAALTACLNAQLSEMHAADLPAPRYGVFQNWANAPFGGGYHSWTPFVRSWDLSAALRQPLADRPLYLCGEAYADLQGWVEGALMDTETLLATAFAGQQKDSQDTAA